MDADFTHCKLLTAEIRNISMIKEMTSSILNQKNLLLALRPIFIYNKMADNDDFK